LFFGLSNFDSERTWVDDDGFNAEEEEDIDFISDSILEAAESIFADFPFESVDEELDSSQAASRVRFELHFVSPYLYYSHPSV
jgi:hypothetical protein